MNISQEQWESMATYNFDKDICRWVALGHEIQDKMNLLLLPPESHGEKDTDGAVDYLDGVFTVKLFEPLNHGQEQKLQKIVEDWKD